MDGTFEATAEPQVVHVIPTAQPRGAQVEARAMASRLDRPGERRHRVLCLFEGEDAVAVDYRLGLHGGDRPAVGFDPRAVVALRRALRRLRPALVVAHGGDPLKYLVPAMAGSTVPLAYYAIGTVHRAAHQPARLAMWRGLLRRPVLVATEGQEVFDECRDLLRVPPSRLVLAPNCRDPELFRPRGDPEPAGEAPAQVPVAMFVGALNDGKQPQRFVEVVAALRDRGVALRAVLVGDGPLRPTLEDPAAAAGVEMLGSRSDVADLLRQADVLVFPSLPTGEGMPGVLIEAGLSGVPVVATRAPGVPMIVSDGETGLVVDVHDTAAMVDATAALLLDDPRRREMGRAARRWCLERFSLDVVSEQWLGFLTPLMRAPAA